MYRFPIIVSLLFGTVYAVSLDTLVHQSLRRHPSLQAIAYKLRQADIRIAQSVLWQNPDIAVTVNDIRFDEPGNRSLEPMQYESVSVMQRLPWFGKTEAKSRIAHEEKAILSHSFDEAKATLARRIRERVYDIVSLRRQLALLARYITVQRRNIDLYNATIATDETHHRQAVAAEMALARFRVRQERYRAALEASEAILRYLTGSGEEKVTFSWRIAPPPSLAWYTARLHDAPRYRTAKAKLAEASARHRLAELEHTPDPYIKAGYFHRNAFEDYASLSVGIAAPVYGNERLESRRTRLAQLETQNELVDIEADLRSRIAALYAQMNEAYRTYRILEKEALPQAEHMLDMSADAIRNGADLFTYTANLEEKLLLEEERIAAAARYLKLRAQLEALIGVYP